MSTTAIMAIAVVVLCILWYYNNARESFQGAANQHQGRNQNPKLMSMNEAESRMRAMAIVAKSAQVVRRGGLGRLVVVRARDGNGNLVGFVFVRMPNARSALQTAARWIRMFPFQVQFVDMFAARMLQSTSAAPR